MDIVQMISPHQIRMARAALRWGVRELAEATGLTANTISRVENGSESMASTIQKIETALAKGGADFISDDGGGGGVRLRRHQVGDRVRLRDASLTGLNYKPRITAKDVGKVIEVEPHPPATGPTYRISVEFSGKRIIPLMFEHEYERAV